MKVCSLSSTSTLVPISVETLRPAQTLDFNLYLRYEPSMSPVLYHERGDSIGKEKIDRLRENDVRLLYVHAVEVEAYQRYLCNTVLRDETLPPQRRIKLLRYVGRESLAKALEARDLDLALDMTCQMTPRIMNLVWQRELAITDLFSALGHDSTIDTHLINVCIYSMILAERLGISDHQSLLRIGQGALLHDLGKFYLPTLNMATDQPLTNKQRTLLRQHPQRGFEELCRRNDLAKGSLLMVYQHHEWPSGRGYPVGLVGEEIHVWSRICAVVNTFDNLTRDRQFHKGALTADVFDALTRQAGEVLDRDMVQCWVALINKRS